LLIISHLQGLLKEYTALVDAPASFSHVQDTKKDASVETPAPDY